MHEEGLFVGSVFFSSSVLDFLLSAVVFPNMGLTFNGIYKKKMRDIISKISPTPDF